MLFCSIQGTIGFMFLFRVFFLQVAVGDILPFKEFELVLQQ